jgi:hypothetical protein
VLGVSVRVRVRGVYGSVAHVVVLWVVCVCGSMCAGMRRVCGVLCDYRGACGAYGACGLRV